MGLDALTDFRILGHDGDDAVGGDAQESGRQECGGRGLLRLGKYFGDGIEMEGNEDASSGDGGDTEKTAAIEECRVHKASFGEGAIQVEGDTRIASIVNPSCKFRNSSQP
jgi:hypothetical protein